MILLPKTLVKKIPKLYETEDTALLDKIAYIKLFLPGTAWTWYIMEYDGKDTCFGYVESGSWSSEYGYFSIKELMDLKSSLGLRVERDISFRPVTINC
jgi:hypothetical protein